MSFNSSLDDDGLGDLVDLVSGGSGGGGADEDAAVVAYRNNLLTVGFAIALTFGLFARLVLTVPSKDGHEFRDRLTAYQARLPGRWPRAFDSYS
jgi:hypothetical protein